MHLRKFLFFSSSSSSSPALTSQPSMTNTSSKVHSTVEQQDQPKDTEFKSKRQKTSNETVTQQTRQSTRQDLEMSTESIKQTPVDLSGAITKTSLFYLIPQFRWRPTSDDELASVESSILSHIKRPFKLFFVNIGEVCGNKENKINTLEMLTDSEIKKQRNQEKPAIINLEDSIEINKKQHQQLETNLSETDQGNKTPLVLVHGFAAGIGFWILNLDDLAEKLNRKIYAFDILGFGRSSRPNFNLDGDVEEQFVDSIERWRASMGLERMIILGHSFGGYLSANYALRHPAHVAHLVLADAWGISEQTVRTDNNNKFRMQLPLYVRMLTSVFQRFNPLAVLRVTGPYGPRLVHTFRTDIKDKFSSKLEDDSKLVLDYIYHCNAQNATGESAFKSLTLPFGWAKNPLINRLLDIDQSIPMSFIYGSRSWIDRGPGEYVKERRGASRVGYHIISGAGHHVYADKYHEFNELVQDICSKVD